MMRRPQTPLPVPARSQRWIVILVVAILVTAIGIAILLLT
jgi:hypothetical protein